MKRWPEGPRFVVRESSGYDAAGEWQTEVMVLDRAYCHRVVWSSLTTRHKSGRDLRSWPLGRQRMYALALAEAWNHQEQLLEAAA